MSMRPIRVHLSRAAALLTILSGCLMSPHQASAQLLGNLIVTITSPAAGSTVSGTTTVSASVTIVGGLLVAGVQFKLDGSSLGAEDTSSPYAVSWNTMSVGNGSHTLTAVARDGLGLLYFSDQITVNVSNAPPPDTTPPSVSIASPGNGATVSGSVTISASASDNVGVTGVQFYLDGSALNSEDTVSPYSTSWNTMSVGNGSHTLNAVARDAAGNRTTSASVNVTVSNADTTAPTVSITSPGSGTTVSGSVTVSATASDNVGVAGVQFYLDGSVLGSEDTASPYSTSWNTSSSSNGSHMLNAVARDAAGNRTTSAGVTVTVSNAPPPDTTPPSVSITSPGNGATVSGSVTISASASDNVGVAGVQFYLDGAALGSEDTASPYSTSWNTTSSANGSHTLNAVARDAAGNRTTSTGVTVTVSNAPPPDTTAPSVSVTSPAGGATVSGTVTISATASDNVGVAGVQFYLDGSALGSEDTALPYSTSWNTTSVGNGTHTLNAVARDAAGNRATSATVSVMVSNGSPPQVTRSEESAATLTPAGAWSQVTSAGAGVTLSGGQGVYSGSAGATASFTFSGTGVSWIGMHCEQCGIARVSLDGSVVATVDSYASSRPASSEAMYSTTGLVSGSHTLLITVTGTGNAASSGALIVVDAFDVEGTTSGGGGGGGTSRSEESAATLAPAGAWSQVTSAGAGVTLSEGQAVYAMAAGATASFSFSGTGVSWVGMHCEQCGIARVSLDGAVVATVDSYAPSRPASSEAMYSTTGLASGSHTLVITVTGTSNSASSAALIVVDAFDVQGGTSGGGGGSTSRLEETNPAVSDTGTWISQTRSDLSGGTLVESNDPNGTATLTFNGTAASWIGFKAPWGGIAKVYVDGTLKASVDSYAPTEQVQAVMYTTGGLAAGPHTLTVAVTGTWNPSGTSAWIVVDAFDVTSSSASSPPPDATPPVVGITSPATGATVSGTITISASASDNVGVAGVQFLVDGSNAGSEDTASPYSLSWTTTTVANGTHTLTAVARDAAGNRTTSAPVTVTVSNSASSTRFEESSATLAPAASWSGVTGASTGVTLSGDFAVISPDPAATATFTFSGTGVSWIGFKCERCGIARVRLDGTVVATVDTYAASRPAASGPMYSTSGLAAGSHTLVIEVTGTNNASSVGPFIVVDAFDVM